MKCARWFSRRTLFRRLPLIGLLAEIVWLERLGWWDTKSAAVFAALRVRYITYFVETFSRCEALLAVVGVALGILVAVRWGASRRDVLRVLAALTIGLVLVQGLKLVLVRDRPGGLPWQTLHDSFPSGHVANAMLCVGASLALLRMTGRCRTLPLLLASGMGIFFVVAVAGARLYLERHWLTDIVASALLIGGYWGAALPIPVDIRRVGTMSVLVLFPYALAICGGQIHLPSPPQSLTVAPTAVSAGAGCARRGRRCGPTPPPAASG